MDRSKQLGGNVGNHWDDGAHSGVREITLVYSSCIDSIHVTYDDNNGTSFRGGKHGGLGGTKAAQIKLGYPEEKLTSVTGYYGAVVYGGFPVIRSLKLKSNRRTFGPFGVEEGTPFSLVTNGGTQNIVGFFGTSGWFLDSIGVYLSSPKPKVSQRMLMMFQGFNLLAHDDDRRRRERINIQGTRDI